MSLVYHCPFFLLVLFLYVCSCTYIKNTASFFKFKFYGIISHPYVYHFATFFFETTSDIIQVTTCNSLLISDGMCIHAQSLSHVWFFVTALTVGHQALLSTEFSRQEYWSGLPIPPPGQLPNPGIEPASPVSLALAGRFFTSEPPGKPWHVGSTSLTRDQTWAPALGVQSLSQGTTRKVLDIYPSWHM